MEQKIPFFEDSRNHRIERFPEFDVIENLDYPEKKDIEDIFELLKKNPLKEGFFLFDINSEIERLKHDDTQRFFVKEKYRPQKIVDSIRERGDPNTRLLIKSLHEDDFLTPQSKYAMAGILNEINISKKIKTIVATSEVQNMVKSYGFDGMGISEPILAFINRDKRENPRRYLTYKYIKSASFFDNNLERKEKIAEDLRKIFYKNGIHPHDLRGSQLRETEQDGKPYIVLIDIEAYTGVDNSAKTP